MCNSQNKVSLTQVTDHLPYPVQSPPSAPLPKFGDTFALNPMFTYFAVQMQLDFLTVANYEMYLPPNVGCRADGGLCRRRENRFSPWRQNA